MARKKSAVGAESHRLLPPGVKLVRTLVGHKDVVKSLAFDPHHEILASGSADGTVKLWATDSGRLLRTLKSQQPRYSVHCVAFDPKGATLAAGSADHTVKFWETRNGQLLKTLDGHMNRVRSVAFKSQDGTLASLSDDGTVKVWEAASGRLLCTLQEVSGWGASVAFSSCGQTLASGSDDGTVKLWHATSGQLLRKLIGHGGAVLSVAYNPLTGILASGSGDDTVKLWDATKGCLLRTLEGHTNSVDVVGFSGNGRLLASKSSDHTIRLWSCETWETIATIPEPTNSDDWIPALAFHPTLPLLATAGSTPDIPLAGDQCQRIHLWELDIDMLLNSQTRASVKYTSAKVVVVGESNVGKSYLSHRVATGRTPGEGMIRSTHGMKFWPLESKRAETGLQTLPVAYADKLFGSQSIADRQHRRDIILWDMGGQEEYRLIHQLFLHDTTVALVLLDPTRGETAFVEVETWNKALEKQLSGRAAVKILVGSKMDDELQVIDRERVERLQRECGFSAFVETSALTGRNVEELCREVSKAIDWKHLSVTNRPELFQAIRDEIELRRKRGNVVVLFDELDNDLNSLPSSEISIYSGEGDRKRTLKSVCRQLAQQGIIARATTSNGKSALILRVEEVERYAGSLILAARANRRDRGVPAIELRTIAKKDFAFPNIAKNDRLPRADETAVVECTVQLLLQHGICFEHEGLLVFPSLFAVDSCSSDENLPHSVSLYYDFAGAIDNIYASLVAWLVLAKEFGRVRLQADRAEFEVQDMGLCGLRKVTRPGGFAHVDVYFDGQTSTLKRQEFISFVEDHLTKYGIEIREHVAIKCPCGEVFAEETLRKRIARGEKDVVCSVCEARHSLVEGAMAAREKCPEVAQHTWALRTKIEEAREQVARDAIETIGRAESLKVDGPITLLHLSDLHFTRDTPVRARLQWLLDDLRRTEPNGLGIKELDYLVISGDFTDRACEEGFGKAYDFVSGLTKEFSLSAERCLFVPGNHDIVDRLDAYTRRKDASGLSEGEWFQEGKLVMGRDPDKYPLRLEPFSKSFYHTFLQRPYPLDYAQQGISVPFWSSGIQFLLFNSCWQIDEFHRKRSGLHVEAVANAIYEAHKQEKEARELGQLSFNQPLLRIAVWHHAVTGPEQMYDTTFLGILQKNGVRLALHGDIHQFERNQVGFRHDKGVHVVGSGSFGVRGQDRPESTPRLFNVIKIARDLNSARVHTRCQPKPDGQWDGWHEWPDLNGLGRVAFYDIEW